MPLRTVRRATTICAAALALSCVAVSVAQRQDAEAGRLSGVVTADDSQRLPLRGAIVTVSGSALARARSVITDESGRFSVAGLPAGRFTLAAAKAPFVTMPYGASRPGRQGTTIVLTAGQAIGDIAIRLPRGAVITGVVRDEHGDPMPDLSVSAIQPGSVDADPSLSSTSIKTATTDERGVYRIYGLQAGDYLVAATFRTAGMGGDIAMPSTEDVDRLFAALLRPLGSATQSAPIATRTSDGPATSAYTFAPTFYPGTAIATDAQRIPVAAGDEHRADFIVAPVHAGSVEGIIQMADGSTPPNIVPSLDADGPPLPAMFGQQPKLTSRTTDGRFKFTGVAPGKYVLSVSLETGSGRSGDPVGVMWATADVMCSGDDVSGIALTLRPGMRLSGRLAFDGTAITPIADPTKVRVVLNSTRRRVRPMLRPEVPFSATGIVNTEGTFLVGGILPGSYLVSIQGAGSWSLRSAMVKGQDAMDAPLDIGGGEDVGGVVITLADRLAELSGTLQTAANAPATDYFVVLFSTDASLWRAGSRRIRSTRPATDGRFAIGDLPGGEYYLAALTDVGPDDLKDASFLSQVAGGALKVTLGDGEKKAQDLRISRQ